MSNNLYYFEGYYAGLAEARDRALRTLENEKKSHADIEGLARLIERIDSEIEWAKERVKFYMKLPS